MLMKFLAIILIGGIFRISAANSLRDGKCLKNETFTECGTACPETCGEMPKICTTQCVIGCECKPGFVRHGAKCIAKHDCPTSESSKPVCLENEEYTECGTACPETCDEIPKICTMQCLVGCQCKSGFVRNKSGKCIRKKDCLVR